MWTYHDVGLTLSVITVLTLLVHVSIAVRCHSCNGRNCREGDCTGDCCYSGYSPLGPYTIYSDTDYIKGCVSFQDTEGPLECDRLRDYLPDASISCDEDFCNGERELDKGARHPTMCQHGTPRKPEICEADLCYRGQVLNEADKMEEILGCSGVSFGLMEKSYCVQPPIGPLLISVPFVSLDPNRPVCFCANERFCNKEPIPPPPDEHPVATVEIWFEKTGMVTGGAASLWLESEKDLPRPLTVLLESKDFGLNISVALTEAGHQLKEQLQREHLEERMRLAHAGAGVGGQHGGNGAEEAEEMPEEAEERPPAEEENGGPREEEPPPGEGNEGEGPGPNAQQQTGDEGKKKEDEPKGKDNTAIIVVFVVIIIVIIIVGVVWKLDLPKKIAASRYSAVS